MDKNSIERKRVGIKACSIAIASNVFLFVLKFILGTITASIAVIADGFNNLSDAASSVVTLISFFIAGKRPDEKHPFGHGRIEYVAALAVSFLILMTGVTFLRDSIQSCRSPAPLNIGLPVYIGLAVSILVKIALGIYTKSLGRKINSVSLIASGTDALNDVIVTCATVVSMAVFTFFNISIDGWIGIVVSVLILKAGIDVIKESLGPLMGEPADPEIVAAIEQHVLSGSGIVGVHDLVVHNYGPGVLIASAHAEIPSDCNLLEMHDVIDRVEAQIKKDLGVEMTIHFDPIDVRSEVVNKARAQIADIVNSVAAGITFHDFRMVTGPTHTNVIFDIVYPFNCPLSESDVLTEIRHRITALNQNYFAVINVDYPRT